MQESFYFFSSLESIGYKAVKKLISFYGSLDVVMGLSDEEVLFTQELTDNQKNEIIDARHKWNFESFVEGLKRKGISVITAFDDNYPEKLRNIPDPPFQLYYSGELLDENLPAVSIIGARNCSEYGKATAKYFASELAKNGVQIISGLASGIDGISQEAAIDAKGRSFGILGCGVDICYPRSNYNLYEKLKINGGVISEYKPGTAPLAKHFPMRNRIISGLSDIVLVVEAKEKSGTAITVSMALEQGKEVFAVPGRINDALSFGCNRLISEGAGVANTVDNILTALDLTGRTVSNMGRIKLETVINDKTLSNEAKKIAEIIYDNPLSVDEIYCFIESMYIQDIQTACMELVCSGYCRVENLKYGFV